MKTFKTPMISDKVWECVIVVVGCDAQGSVGSSGDVNIGVGNNDTTTDGETPFDPNTLLPPTDSLDCSECITPLGADVLDDLRAGIRLITYRNSRLKFAQH